MTASLDDLPTELIYRIFDFLDSTTIIFNVRPVSKRFRSIAASYNRYRFDFQWLSEVELHAMCRLIRPEQIISLTLSNYEKVYHPIESFISVVDLRQLTRLRSLTLREPDQNQIGHFDERINWNTIRTFSITFRREFNQLNQYHSKFLESLVSKANIEKFDLNLNGNRVMSNFWSKNCSIKHLVIHHRVQLTDLFFILENCPLLHTIVLESGYSGLDESSLPKAQQGQLFRQLRSLTVRSWYEHKNWWEVLLPRTPELIDLKVIVCESKIFDGKKWEDFIEMNLPSLKNFQFYVPLWYRGEKSTVSPDDILKPFRSPFWLQQKRWFVALRRAPWCSYSLYLFSLPICTNSTKFVSQSRHFLGSTCPEEHSHLASNVDSIEQLDLHITAELIKSLQKKKVKTALPYFPMLTKLDITFPRTHLNWSMMPLWSALNMNRITEIKLIYAPLMNDDPTSMSEIKAMFSQACHLSKLRLCLKYSSEKYIGKIDNIIDVLPPQIKFLEISIGDLNQLLQILDRCKDLVILELNFLQRMLVNEIKHWLEQSLPESKTEYFGVKLRVGFEKKKTIQSTIGEPSNKRMKLDDNFAPEKSSF